MRAYAALSRRLMSPRARALRIRRTSFPARIDALEMQEIFAKHSPSYGIYEAEKCEAAAARKNLVPATLGKGVKGARLISGDKFMMQEMQTRQDLNKYGVPRTGVDSLPGSPCAAGMERGCIPRLIHQFAYEARAAVAPPA